MIALVTGANRGLGFEISRQLAKLDMTVILTSRNTAEGLEAQKQLADEGLEVFYHQLDVTDPKSIDTLYDFVKKKFNRLDILINNAGIMIEKNRSFIEASLDKIKQTMETNVYGPFLMCQKFISLMLQNNYGRIVNISSGMGQLSSMGGGYTAYRLSKTALNALTKTIAEDLKQTNILVNSMCPGWVKTRMGGPNATKTTEEASETAIYLATLPDNSPSGGYYMNKLLVDF